MASKSDNLRATLKSIFLLQRNKGLKTLSFYKELLNSTSKDEEWVHYKEPPFYNSMRGLIPLGKISPVYILETALETIDTYLEAIDNFSDDQFYAFLLGVGLNWFPLQYWGTAELKNYLDKINKALVFYKQLEAELPPGEMWKFEREGLFEMLPGIIPPERYAPTRALRVLKELVEGMISVLEQKS